MRKPLKNTDKYYCRSVQTVQVLLKNGAKSDSEDASENTISHVAARYARYPPHTVYTYPPVWVPCLREIHARSGKHALDRKNRPRKSSIEIAMIRENHDTAREVVYKDTLDAILPKG